MEYRCRTSKPGQQGLSGVIDQGKYSIMVDTNLNKEQRLEQHIKVPATPNESGRLEVQDHVRIFDPNTKETLLEKRA